MIILLLFVIAGGYAAICTVAGFATPTTSLEGFSPQLGGITRRFAETQDAVQVAYCKGAHQAPGMRVCSEADNSMLVDLRPTSRILSGNFGLLLRVTTSQHPDGTDVRVDAARKVSFAVFVNHSAALVHAERTLRMCAKRHGITEVLHVDESPT